MRPGALDGASYVVTGGGGGIGAASAELLVRDGAHVVLVGRTAATLDDASARIATATGHGELFIRYTVARDICARVEYAHEPLAQAADDVVMHELVPVGGDGGVIALDAQGHWAMPFNTPGMYRAFRLSSGAGGVEIFGPKP